LPRKLQDPAWTVDAGPQAFSEQSGGAAVCARMPLIAFNVNLATGDLEVAKQIANAVRHVGGGLRYVKAIGLRLEEKGIVQVSMSITNYQRTPIHRALELIRSEASRYGVVVRECELAGLVPIEALEEVVSFYLQMPKFHSRQITEYHLLPE
jgi:glutamate formiminotransferase